MKLATRMKMYESDVCSKRPFRGVPVIVRLDGKAFHGYTKNMNRPYDVNFCGLMIDVAKFLLEQMNALLAYTQSDEISLLLYAPADSETQLFFNGKYHKLNSVCASMCTLDFHEKAKLFFDPPPKMRAYFDCRSFMVPTKQEAINYFIWRERDAIKNSIMSAVRTKFSHKELQSCNTDKMKEMLLSKGIDWSEYPNYFKYGRYIQRQKIARPFTEEEIEGLTPKHEAHKNPDLKVIRSTLVPVAQQGLQNLNCSLVDCIFNKEEHTGLPAFRTSSFYGERRLYEK